MKCDRCDCNATRLRLNGERTWWCIRCIEAVLGVPLKDRHREVVSGSTLLIHRKVESECQRLMNEAMEQQWNGLAAGMQSAAMSMMGEAKGGNLAGSFQQALGATGGTLGSPEAVR